MARPSNTDERRAQIARGLLTVMAAKGYDGASVAHIAKAAGIAPGVVHYHFKDKQEILVAALHAIVRHHNGALDAAEARAPDAIGKPAAFIDLHLGLGATADARALAAWVMLSGEAIRQPRFRTQYREAMAGFAERAKGLIESGVQARLFRCDDPSAAAAALLATIQGYFVLAASAPAVVPSGSAAAAARKMADGLLKPVRPFPKEGAK